MTCLLRSDWLSYCWLGRWWIKSCNRMSPTFHSTSNLWWIITCMEWTTSTSVLSDSGFPVPLVILHPIVSSIVVISNFIFQRMMALKQRCCLPLRSVEGDPWPLLSSLPSPRHPVPPFSSTPVRVCGMSTHCQGTFSLSLSLSRCYPPFYPIISDLILCEPRRSVTELEVDIVAADILNRHELSLGRRHTI